MGFYLYSIITPSIFYHNLKFCRYISKNNPQFRYNLMFIPTTSWNLNVWALQINLLKPRQNGRHLVDDICGSFRLMKSFLFWFKIHSFCSQWSSWQYASIGSSNGLVTFKTNIDIIHRCINALPGLNVLRGKSYSTKLRHSFSFWQYINKCYFSLP